MKFKLIRLLTLSLATLVSGIHADSSQVEARNGWINNLPPSVPMRAGYLLLENDGRQAVSVERIESNAFGSVEMHQTVSEQGVMKMIEISAIQIPADGQAELKPGGMHLMLMQPRIALPPGTEVPLTLHFDDGGQMEIRLKVAD